MSQVERVTDIMHRLLWNNILEVWVSGILRPVPVVGLPVIRSIVMWLIDKFVVVPLFEILVRYGVFTSIDWGTEEVYNAYEAEAKKIVGMQDAEEWPENERKAFRDAARKLIHFELPS